MLKEMIKKGAYAIAPRLATKIDNRLWMSNQVRQLRQRCADSQRLEDVVDLVLESPWFSADQKRTEILDLLKCLQREPPRRVCEIGARHGGTLVLFAQVASPDARILSMDINYTPLQIRTNCGFSTGKQQIDCLQADSHDPATLRRVREWLKEEPLDFLFIDGDHSLFGVQSDFTMYAPLVRSGGIIAFHDIVPDFKTRFGTPTIYDVGQVPAFWENLKSRGYIMEELIENGDQDGMGIGVVRWSGERQ